MTKKVLWAALILLGVGIIIFVSQIFFSSHSLKERPNLLVITMDTTRADHLGCFGYDRIKTPHIDAAAREGVLFEEAFSVQPITLPSHCSIFTGKYPFHHGVRDNNIYRLGEESLTLAEILKERSYLTAAFLSSYILDHQFGLDQGFQLYNDRFLKPKQKGKLPVDRRAAEVSLLACKWLEINKEALEKHPFFLWLHYYDPHADYDPPSPYREAYPNSYDGEIAYMDDWIGYVFDELKRRGWWDNTIVVLVADHGESLGEYGEQTHGVFIYRPTTRVPLIMRYPRALPQGLRIKEKTTTVDIFPTLLNLLHVKSREAVDGRSLVPLMKGKLYETERPIYSEAFIPRSFNWSELKGIRQGEDFFIEAPRPELYTLRPGEKEEENLIDSYPVKAEEMKHTLLALLADKDQTRAEKVAVTEDMIDRLKSLGYFVGGGQSGEQEDETGSRPDPKDNIRLFNLYQRANSLDESGRHEQAIALYNEIIEQDPHNPRFLMELGDIHVRHGEFEAAEKHLKHALSVSRDDARCLYLLGVCYEGWRKTGQAIESYREAIRQNRDHFLAHFHLGLIHIRASRWDEAEQAFLEAKRIRPNDALSLNNLGYIAIKGRDDFPGGIGLIEEALKINPENPSILSSLGWACYNAEDYEKARTCLEAALALVPDNLTFIRQLKAVYEATGDKENLDRLKNRERILETGMT